MPEHPLCAVTRSTRVIEHFADLGAEAGQDRGLEESVSSVIFGSVFISMKYSPVFPPKPPALLVSVQLSPFPA